MEEDKKYIQQAIDLASNSLGSTYPNPMVGAVIVHQGKIIGTGYHRRAGENHAEVLAIESVKEKRLLSKSTLYVNLEPCSHYGKTPPCTNLIIKNKIPRVVIGTADPFPEVNGEGINQLRKAGVEVTVGVLEEECRQLNKRFFCYQQNQRPYVILKWARTADGFVDGHRKNADTPPLKITGRQADKLSHSMRSVEQAILVGTRTALLDNPRLSARLYSRSKNPLRVLIDRRCVVPKDYNLKDGNIATLVFTENQMKSRSNLTYCVIDFSKDIIPQILSKLHELGIQSLIVEGGTKTIDSFIQSGMWDEAVVFTSPVKIGDGVKCPHLDLPISKTQLFREDRLDIYYRE